jgi:methyl-accepting chemotaxis protein
LVFLSIGANCFDSTRPSLKAIDSEKLLNLVTDPGDSFRLSNWIKDNLTSLLRNEQAMLILQVHLMRIIQKNLGYINSEYIKNAKQTLDNIIKTMPQEDRGQIGQLRSLSLSLSELLKNRTTISRLLRTKKENVEHPFADLDDPLFSAILYMFKYIETDEILTIADCYKEISTKISDEKNKKLFEQTATTLSNLIANIQDISEQAEALAESMEDGNDILDQKYPQLPNLSRAAAEEEFRSSEEKSSERAEQSRRTSNFSARSDK